MGKGMERLDSVLTALEQLPGFSDVNAYAQMSGAERQARFVEIYQRWKDSFFAREFLDVYQSIDDALCAEGTRSWKKREQALEKLDALALRLKKHSHH